MSVLKLVSPNQPDSQQLVRVRVRVRGGLMVRVMVRVRVEA